MTHRRNKESDRIQDLVDNEEELSRKLSNLEFHYSNPSANFDRSQVKGMVAELISLEKENYDASTALEICAGGRLYNVGKHETKEKLILHTNLLSCFFDRWLSTMKKLVLSYSTVVDFVVGVL